MGSDRDEPGLSAAFRQLRAETEERFPAFAPMIARAREHAGAEPTVVPIGARRARRRARLIGAVATAVAATAATLLLVRRPDADAEFDRLVASYASDASGGAWRSPTGGLLEVPGMTFTRTTPSIGMPLRDLDAELGADGREGRES